MRAFNRIFTAVLLIIVLVFAGANLFLLNWNHAGFGRPYRVEINRLALAIEENGAEHISLSGCEYVTDVCTYSEDFYDSKSDYAIREINGQLYRFDYVTVKDSSEQIVIVNVIIAMMAVLMVAVMLYIKLKILAPFERLKEVPYELSKGNLTAPLKESKNRFFGRFFWGVDLLRENIEAQKRRELELQKERKMLLLSLSHDIKTPLSAIKLYARALSRGLYADKEKQHEIADNINRKADEIEGYVSQIIVASREDFLSLEVTMGEFYLSGIVRTIGEYYKEKLLLNKTDFTIGSYRDCMIRGDEDRSIEVIQNVVENAVKYGDSKHIALDFAEEDGCILITVSNSGCTLDENELPHMFDSFWRGTNAEKQNGSGLGLYICRQLMHKMGGEIFAKINGECMEVTAVFGKA